LKVFDSGREDAEGGCGGGGRAVHVACVVHVHDYLTCPTYLLGRCESEMQVGRDLVRVPGSGLQLRLKPMSLLASRSGSGFED